MRNIDGAGKCPAQQIMLVAQEFGSAKSATAPTRISSTVRPVSTCSSPPSSIILWNTRYLERALATLRQTEDVPDRLLAHLSPLGWEHVNLTGDYVWGAQSSASENAGGLRPLRMLPEAYPRAAYVRNLSAYAYQEASSLPLAMFALFRSANYAFSRRECHV